MIAARVAQDGSAGVLLELGAHDDDAASADATAGDLLEGGVQSLEEARALQAGVRNFVRYDLQGTGRIAAHVHMEGAAGVLLEMAAGSAGTAAREEFRGLQRDIALHITAVTPRFLSRAEMSGVDRDKSRHERRVAELVLLEQPFMKDPDVKVWELLEEKGRELGDTVAVRRFTRWAASK